MRRTWRIVAAATLLFLGVSPTASAHSLESSTIAVRIGGGQVEATISLAVETLDQALGTDYLAVGDASTAEWEAASTEIIAYLDEHLTVTGADGSEWTETFSEPERTTVEGIESFSVEVAFDSGGESVDEFTLEYDAIIEALSDHEAVVVLTDSADEISTAGVITSADSSLTLTDGQQATPTGDMIRYGFDHVLEGADHLLFVITLLLPASLIAMNSRWRTGRGPGSTLLRVVHVATAFTIGHSITLMASALGWVSVPTRPTEVLVAVSVAASALHAIRPLARRGEVMIAGGFGLVHGLAFAGILASLGVQGSTSVATLLAFNIGVELAQLWVIVLLFPSMYVISKTRAATAFRISVASLALLAALGWVVDRVGLRDNPLQVIEDLAIGNPWTVVLGLAALAASLHLCFTVSRRRPTTSSLTSPGTVAAHVTTVGPGQPRVGVGCDD